MTLAIGPLQCKVTGRTASDINRDRVKMYQSYQCQNAILQVLWLVKITEISVVKINVLTLIHL